MTNGIGVIDSGVGGLTVAKEIMRQLPQESILYFGDTARCPYGPRPPEEVRTFTLQMISYLSQFQIKALVIACNTATAVVLKEVSETIQIPVIGVIDPGARTAIKETRDGKIGVIGTVGTIHSGAYEKALKRINPDVSVYSYACPELVPLVESGITDRDKALSIVRRSLQPFTGKKIDTLILGCTHYPLLSELIGEIMGDGVTLINSAEETARELSVVLDFKSMLAAPDQSSLRKHKFFVSGRSSVMEQIAQSFLDAPIDLQQVDVSKDRDYTHTWNE